MPTPTPPPPSKSRVLIPIAAVVLAAIVVTVIFTGPGRSRTPSGVVEPEAPAEVSGAGAGADAADPAVSDGDESAVADADPGAAPDDDASASAAAADDGVTVADADADAEGALDLTGLVAGPAPSGDILFGGSIGSLDPDEATMEVSFDLNGAGLASIAFSDIWETAEARRAARDYREAVEAGKASEVEPPDESLRYILAGTRTLEERQVQVPELAAVQVVINGQTVTLLRGDAELADGAGPLWSRTGEGRFATEIRTADGTPVLRITRTYTLEDRWAIGLDQRIENLSGRDLEVQWWQYGPGDLRVDRSRYMDRRRYRFGVGVPGTEGGTLVLAPTGGGGLIEHSSLEKRDRDAVLWPGKVSEKGDEPRELSWFAVTNRYFGFAVHPPVDETGAGPLTLTGTVDNIRFERSFDYTSGKQKVDAIFVYLGSPEVTLAAGESTSFDFGVFAGPLERHDLDQARYGRLGLDNLILYQMSAFCAMCTFQWLARLLLAFLTMLETSVVFDWGMAIVLLVITVRLILHPITKKSQAGMQRFGKAMAAMKPEIEKLQKKYKEDPKRMQAAQLQLMREHGVNPLQALGCLPMFLQTPIWIALYAMLYFTFDLRHEAAFYGIFQTLTGGAWPFLSDLSSGDHFFGAFETPVRLLFINVTGINVLPILLGVVFFVQQKYLAPPPSATMTPEQAQQQKIMRFVMVFLFPVMLYSAPSGLILYMLTSSGIGIIESRYIRRHVEAEDAARTAAGEGPGAKRTADLGALVGGKKKPKDAQARAYMDALQARKKKIDEKRANKKSYKRKK